MEQHVVLTLTAGQRIAAVVHLRHAALDYKLRAGAAVMRDDEQSSREYLEWQREADKLADLLQDALPDDRARCDHCGAVLRIHARELDNGQLLCTACAEDQGIPV